MKLEQCRIFYQYFNDEALSRQTHGIRYCKATTSTNSLFITCIICTTLQRFVVLFIMDWIRFMSLFLLSLSSYVYFILIFFKFFRCFSVDKTLIRVFHISFLLLISTVSFFFFSSTWLLLLLNQIDKSKSASLKTKEFFFSFLPLGLFCCYFFFSISFSSYNVFLCVLCGCFMLVFEQTFCFSVIQGARIFFLLLLWNKK